MSFIKPVLGVIPNNKDNMSFWHIQKLLANSKRLGVNGWSIAMHGYNHHYDKETNKKIILIMAVSQSFSVIRIKINYQKLKMVLTYLKKMELKLILSLLQTIPMMKILLKL